MPKLARRFWRRALVVGLALLFVWFGSALVVTWKLIHRVGPRTSEALPEIDWAHIRELRLHTFDSEELGAWWIETAEPRAVALLLHGNDSDRSECLSTARILAHEHVDCLLVTFARTAIPRAR
ncbi:MAG: hypothetical protein IPJ19_05785 [Planctomycetes bacterium]|nr:hypothetical protein [Planctomycetota bacterium]